MSRGRAETFQHMRKMITNLQANEELAKSAAAVGVDTAMIQRGQVLLERADHHDQQHQQLTKELKITAAALKSTRNALRKLYNHQRRLARLEITSGSVRILLGLDDEPETGYTMQLEQARRFYAAALSSPSLLAALDAVSITRPKLETGQALVTQLTQLITSELNLRATKEQATADLRIQMRQMAAWMRATTTLVRFGATAHPQLLKAISHEVHTRTQQDEE